MHFSSEQIKIYLVEDDVLYFSSEKHPQVDFIPSERF